MKILWLKSELLHPVDKGGKIRTYHMLRHLRQEHRVVYLTLDDGRAAEDASERAREYCDELIGVPHATRDKEGPGFYAELAANLVSRFPYAVDRWRSPSMRRAVAERVGRGDLDLLVCDFLVSAANLPAGLKLPTVLFQHNVEAAIWERRRKVASNPLKTAYFWFEWRRMFGFERRASQRFDTVVAVSDRDRERMERDYGLEGVRTVPTGVDTDFFRPAGRRERRPHHLVFTGSMDWMPNADAVRWFATDILPLVREEIPDVSVTIVGRDPGPDLRRLADEDSGLEVTGWVEDVRPYVEEAAVYVVPLRVGGGTRLKVYEAMAMERPVVSTPVGVEGLPVRGGTDLRVAADAGAFAAAVVELLEDPAGAGEMARAAAERVRDEFGWAGVAEQFADICRATAARERDLAVEDGPRRGSRERALG